LIPRLETFEMASKKGTPAAPAPVATEDEEVFDAGPTAAELGLDGYAELEDSEIQSWADLHAKNELVQGTVHRIRPAGKGKVLDMMVDGAVQTFGCPRILERKLEDMIGRQVAILCLGKTVETENGTAWGFRVFAKPAK
jgi:hypothetical protein